MGAGITPLSDDDAEAIARVVNEAAKTYAGTIPDDCYSEPYLSVADLRAELETAEFYGSVVESTDSPGSPPSADSPESADALAGIVGFEDREDASFVHRLYVRPDFRNEGIGSRLLDFALGQLSTPVLVGTWRDAHWAIRFYQKHGFDDLGNDRELLRTHWDHSERRIEESVVLRYEE